MVEQITRDVRRFATAELERRQGELRAEMTTAIQGANRLGLTAIVLTVLTLLVVALSVVR